MDYNSAENYDSNTIYTYIVTNNNDSYNFYKGETQIVFGSSAGDSQWGKIVLVRTLIFPQESGTFHCYEAIAFNKVLSDADRIKVTRIIHKYAVGTHTGELVDVDMGNNNFSNLRDPIFDTDVPKQKHLYGFLKSNMQANLNLTSLSRDGKSYMVMSPYICLIADNGFISDDIPKASMNTQKEILSSAGTGIITLVQNEANGHAAYKMSMKSIMFKSWPIMSFVLVMKYSVAESVDHSQILLGHNQYNSFHDGATTIFRSVFSDTALDNGLRVNMVPSK